MVPVSCKKRTGVCLVGDSFPWRGRMDLPLPNQLFLRFSELVYRQCGINLHDGKKALLQARLTKRLRATHIDSYEDYYQYLQNNPKEMVHFLDSVSTNLTFFFRESQHFDFLESIALPGLLEEKQAAKNNRLRIWSAGCSTGEEPYSLAMCVLGHMDSPQRWDFKILATDISTRVLEAASGGIYAEEKVLKVPPELRRQYFEKCGEVDGKPAYEASPALKRLITFRRLNLKDPFPFKGLFDYIFCRNVMIYFDKQTQEALIQKMTGFLSPGGYLFVGHSESLTGLSHALSYVKPAVYRKPC